MPMQKKQSTERDIAPHLRELWVLLDRRSAAGEDMVDLAVAALLVAAAAYRSAVPAATDESWEMSCESARQSAPGFVFEAMTGAPVLLTPESCTVQSRRSPPDV